MRDLYSETVGQGDLHSKWRHVCTMKQWDFHSETIRTFIFWNSERLTSVRDLHSETVRERFTFWNDDRFIFWNSETETHCKQCEICILKQRERLKFWNNETETHSKQLDICILKQWKISILKQWERFKQWGWDTS